MQNIKQICNGPVQGNTYIVGNGNSCYIIDPGYDYNQIIEYTEKNYSKVKAILLTHGHFDHCGAVDQVANYFKCKTYMDLKDMVFITTPSQKALYPLFGFDLKLETPITSIDEFDDPNVIVLHTPGHSEGSVSFIFKDSNAIFTGDCLFAFDIGRTDLPGGNMNEMLESLKMLASLSDNFTVYPGHEMIGNMSKMKHGMNSWLSRDV